MEAVNNEAVTGEARNNHTNRNSRNERSSKGRRRRAAAEQRRIDQQRWGQYITDGEEDTAVGTLAMAPRPANRRRARRQNRHNSDHRIEDYYEDELVLQTNHYQEETSDDFNLEMALLLSLSLADSTHSSERIVNTNGGIINMSYESLVQLENVKCVAPMNIVNSMMVVAFDGNSHQQELMGQAEKCAICQCEYEFGDQIICLACTHGFHHACGSKWLLNHSKLCPICKDDVTDQKLPDRKITDSQGCYTTFMSNICNESMEAFFEGKRHAA